MATAMDSWACPVDLHPIELPADATVTRVGEGRAGRAYLIERPGKPRRKYKFFNEKDDAPVEYLRLRVLAEVCSSECSIQVAFPEFRKTSQGVFYLDSPFVEGRSLHEVMLDPEVPKGTKIRVADLYRRGLAELSSAFTHLFGPFVSSAYEQGPEPHYFSSQHPGLFGEQVPLDGLPMLALRLNSPGFMRKIRGEFPDMGIWYSRAYLDEYVTFEALVKSDNVIVSPGYSTLTIVDPF